MDGEKELVDMIYEWMDREFPIEARALQSDNVRQAMELICHHEPWIGLWRHLIQSAKGKHIKKKLSALLPLLDLARTNPDLFAQRVRYGPELETEERILVELAEKTMDETHLAAMRGRERTMCILGSLKEVQGKIDKEWREVEGLRRDIHRQNVIYGRLSRLKKCLEEIASIGEERRRMSVIPRDAMLHRDDCYETALSIELKGTLANLKRYTEAVLEGKATSSEMTKVQLTTTKRLESILKTNHIDDILLIMGRLYEDAVNKRKEAGDIVIPERSHGMIVDEWIDGILDGDVDRAGVVFRIFGVQNAEDLCRKVEENRRISADKKRHWAIEKTRVRLDRERIIGRIGTINALRKAIGESATIILSSIRSQGAGLCPSEVEEIQMCLENMEPSPIYDKENATVYHPTAPKGMNPMSGFEELDLSAFKLGAVISGLESIEGSKPTAFLDPETAREDLKRLRTKIENVCSLMMEK